MATVYISAVAVVFNQTLYIFVNSFIIIFNVRVKQVREGLIQLILYVMLFELIYSAMICRNREDRVTVLQLVIDHSRIDTIANVVIGRLCVIVALISCPDIPRSPADRSAKHKGMSLIDTALRGYIFPFGGSVSTGDPIVEQIKFYVRRD